ncbi:MAG: PAS domain S-box protein [Desulfomonilaceae bacterium]
MTTGKIPDSEEIQCTRNDGSRITLGSGSAPVRDLPGQIVFGVGVFRDITENKQANVALRKSEERLHLDPEAAKAATWEWNLQTDKH